MHNVPPTIINQIIEIKYILSKDKTKNKNCIQFRKGRRVV